MRAIKNNRVSLLIILFFTIAAGIIYFSIRPREFELDWRRDDAPDRYEVNDIMFIYITEADLAQKYLVDYSNSLLFYPREAYELLDDECRDMRFPTYESFDRYRTEQMQKGLFTMLVAKYGFATEQNKRSIKVTDTGGNTFRFIEDSLMNYRVVIE